MKKAKFILAVILLSTVVIYSCKKTEPIVEETTKPVNFSEVELFTEKSVPSTCPFVGIATHPFRYSSGNPIANKTCVDGVDRVYSVHVPTTYDPTGNYPVVFLFHGGGQNYSDPYIRGWGWRALVDQEDIIVISMDSWSYTMDSGAVKKRWNTTWLSGLLQNAADTLNDVEFVRQVYEILKYNLAVDTGRIYASGFSDGCSFIKSRILSDMGDIFAAASGAGNLGIDPYRDFPTYDVGGSPIEKATISFFGMHGTDDANLIAACNVSHLTLNPTVIIDTSYCLFPYIQNMLDYMRVDTSGYTTSSLFAGTPLEATHFSFTNSTDPSLNNQYLFQVAKGEPHKYPERYSAIFWNWMKNQIKV